MKAGRGCWTCKERKVQCDRGLPACQNCSRLRRACQGYGLRLSWPRAGDKRRAVTGASPFIGTPAHQAAHHIFLHTTWWDLQLYHQLSQPRVVQPTYPVRPNTNPWRTAQPRAMEVEMELVQYFHDVAYHILVTFTANSSEIRDALLRMALAKNTIPAAALYYALLAVSSLRRNGLQPEALKFKVAALHALSTSAKGGTLNMAEAAQHVATCMLLCAFEIQLPSESSGEWLWHTQGALDIIRENQLERHSAQSDINALIDWAYYHYVISRFTMHHWHHKSVIVGGAGTNNRDLRGARHSPLVKSSPVPRPPSPTYGILNLLAETCDTLLDPWDPRTRDGAYCDRLRTLEKKITSLPASQSKCEGPFNSGSEAMAVELYRMATLIYLMRASETVWSQSAKLDSLVDRALSIPLQAPYCDHFFPLFIVACEARTDQQRVTILGLIERTEKLSHVRSMSCLKAGIRSIWAQRDLHADSDLVANYLRLLSAVVSSSSTLPSYV